MISAISEAAPLLSATDVSVAYPTGEGTLTAVRDASLTLSRGEVLGIVGESGSGKSTLAQSLIGYRPPGARCSGQVVFDGVALLEAPAAALRDIWGRRIAMVHQNPLATLTPTLTVGTQITEVLRRHRRMGRGEAQARMLACLEGVNLPHAADIARRYPHQLSGGERQRISIAIALSLEPDLLVLDEPTTNLDATTEAAILDLLDDIKARVRTAMIYISHNLGVIAHVADRVAVMYAGEIVETGPAAAIFARPSHPYTHALLGCLPRPGRTKRELRLQTIPGAFPSLRDRETGCVFRGRCGKRLDVCDRTPAWTALAPDHAVRCWSPQTQSATGEAGTPATSARPGSTFVLDAATLTKTFPGRGAFPAKMRAVDEAELRVPENAIVGLVGESGSGKSTLLRCIAGLETPDQGTLRFLGLDLPTDLASRRRETLRSIQMVFQDPESTLNPALTAGENLRRHLQALRPMTARAADEAVDRVLEQVRLPQHYRDRLPHQLSGGEKQRVAIARAVLSEPRLILCDEPLSALDVSVQSAICQLLLDLQRDGRMAYIFVSHDLSIVRYIADHIVVMYLGVTVEQGPAESFDTLPLHPYSEALFSASPIPDPSAKGRRILLSGQISDVQRDSGGCIFKARCPRRIGPVCDQQEPAWQAVAGRRYRCHHASDALRAIQSEGA